MFIKQYFDFSLSRAGVRSNFLHGASWGARFKLDKDVRPLFPYINATFQNAKFYDKPESIQFVLDGYQCSLYPDEVFAAPFSDEKQALEFAKGLIDFLNDLYSRKGSLEPNHKKIRTISVLDIYKLLPQTNCKECGFSNYLAFASALSKGQAYPDHCPGFSNSICENAVYPVYDMDGNLVSSVAIEIDATKRKDDSEKQQKYIESLEKKLADEKQKNKAVAEDKNIQVQTDLTDREIQVLRLVAQGATNTEISHKLSISRHTVKSHVDHIFNKLGVNDRTQAAVWATRHNIV